MEHWIFMSDIQGQITAAFGIVAYDDVGLMLPVLLRIYSINVNLIWSGSFWFHAGICCHVITWWWVKGVVWGTTTSTAKQRPNSWLWFQRAAPSRQNQSGQLLRPHNGPSSPPSQIILFIQVQSVHEQVQFQAFLLTTSVSTAFFFSCACRV